MAVLLLAAGCGVAADGVIPVTVDDYDLLAARDDVFVIDVHVPLQQQLPFTDAVIPYDDLGALMAALPDKTAPVLLYCRSGTMSALAAEALVSEGYTAVYDLQGGKIAYDQK